MSKASTIRSRSHTSSTYSNTRSSKSGRKKARHDLARRLKLNTTDPLTQTGRLKSSRFLWIYQMTMTTVQVILNPRISKELRLSFLIRVSSSANFEQTVQENASEKSISKNLHNLRIKKFAKILRRLISLWLFVPRPGLVRQDGAKVSKKSQFPSSSKGSAAILSADPNRQKKSCKINHIHRSCRSNPLRGMDLKSSSQITSSIRAPKLKPTKTLKLSQPNE